MNRLWAGKQGGAGRSGPGGRGGGGQGAAWVTNCFGDMPGTVLAPTLLQDNVTIRRANEKNEKLSFYPSLE